MQVPAGAITLRPTYTSTHLAWRHSNAKIHLMDPAVWRGWLMAWMGLSLWLRVDGRGKGFCHQRTLFDNHIYGQV